MKSENGARNTWTIQKGNLDNMKKKRKQKENKLTKKDWIELLEFWPLSIVTPAMILLILFGPYIMR